MDQFLELMVFFFFFGGGGFYGFLESVMRYKWILQLIVGIL